jgi:hypothetical protein
MKKILISKMVITAVLTLVFGYLAGSFAVKYGIAKMYTTDIVNLNPDMATTYLVDFSASDLNHLDLYDLVGNLDGFDGIYPYYNGIDGFAKNIHSYVLFETEYQRDEPIYQISEGRALNDADAESTNGVLNIVVGGNAWNNVDIGEQFELETGISVFNVKIVGKCDTPFYTDGFSMEYYSTNYSVIILPNIGIQTYIPNAYDAVYMCVGTDTIEEYSELFIVMQDNGLGLDASKAIPYGATFNMEEDRTIQSKNTWIPLAIVLYLLLTVLQLFLIKKIILFSIPASFVMWSTFVYFGVNFSKNSTMALAATSEINYAFGLEISCGFIICAVATVVAFFMHKLNNSKKGNDEFVSLVKND